MTWLLLAGAAVCLAGLLAFRGHRVRRVLSRKAERAADGAQEATIVVDHGYVPSRIELEAGVPTRLRFERREADPCTELLVCELLPSQHRLAARAETVVSFTPSRPGRYAFTCGMGMYSGVLVVRPTSQRALRAGPSGPQWPGPASASDQREGDAGR
ncbi:MAG: cupredoxin domain-containing protein [Candidatus Limnocylindria bacterium]|nr:cupredoxin domain-containing protein [Candidatus Limnocylindria bacterium]